MIITEPNWQNVVTEQLNQLYCFTDIEAIFSIAQGDSHTCFKVVEKNKTYFVKGIVKHQDFKVLQQSNVIASTLDFAPKLIYLDNSWQVNEFINGQSLSLISLPINDKIKSCIAVMSLCHQKLSHSTTLSRLPALEPTKIINELKINLPEALDKIVVKIRDKLSYVLTVTPSTVCHGDLNFSNIIVAKKLWLIDFECLSIADAEYDLAMLVAVNELAYAPIDLIIEQCIKEYSFRGKGKIELSKELVTCYLVFCYLINGLWYLRQSFDTDNERFELMAGKQFDHLDKLGFIPESLLEQMR